MLSKIGVWLIGSAVCAFLYHLAGIGGFKSAKLLRRLGCPLIVLGMYIALSGLNWGFWWAYLAFLGLNYGAMSTYNDYLAPDGTSENWLCWWVTGFLYALSAFPLCIASGRWIGFGIRTVILAIGVMWVRERTGKVEIEELSSGGLYALTLPLLLI